MLDSGPCGPELDTPALDLQHILAFLHVRQSSASIFNDKQGPTAKLITFLDFI